jgi:hypothetical protein
MTPPRHRVSPVLGALALAATSAAAQTPPPVAEACYVPTSGTVYRVDTPKAPAPGAPKQCLSPSHVRFGWVALALLANGALDLSTPAGFASAVADPMAAPALTLSGPGTRLVWYPRKSAIRAGAATSSEWNESAIGLFSAAFGGGTNTFRVRAAGGTIIASNAQGNAGVILSPGNGAWESVSDVRKKTAFRDVDGEALLATLAAMPVRTWQYRSQAASIRHMGPTAQDFRRAFGLGESDTTITTVDADGVALAAARALARRTAAMRRENAALRASGDSLRRRLAAIERTLASVTAIHDIANAARVAPPARTARPPRTN